MWLLFDFMSCNHNFTHNLIHPIQQTDSTVKQESYYSFVLFIILFFVVFISVQSQLVSEVRFALLSLFFITFSLNLKGHCAVFERIFKLRDI